MKNSFTDKLIELNGYTLKECKSKNIWNIDIKFWYVIFEGIKKRKTQKNKTKLIFTKFRFNLGVKSANSNSVMLLGA